MIEGPDELRADSNATFTCKSPSTVVERMTFRVVSYETDYFEDLDKAGFVAIDENPMGEIITAKSLTIIPELLWNQCQVGRTLTIECSIEETCNGEKVYNSISKTATLNGMYFSKKFQI